ncbi:hypothetical protein TWF594_009088 [Orbilia oligospora]|nr:hypothetical protein TWF594_009088 [Orbilia oligospora]
MVFSKISVILTGAALLQSAEAHVRFLGVRGNHDPSRVGISMGYDDWFTGAIARGGAKLSRFPDQFDTVVFSNPTIPGKCCSVTYKGFPRYVMPQGCGTTLKIQDTYYRKNRWRDDRDYLTSAYYEHGQEMENYRLWNFFMSPIPYGAFAPISIVHEQAEAGKVPQATAGGWIEIDVYLVNEDGGGAMTCRLDKSATGQGFGGHLNILQQPWLKWPGQTNKLKVQIPADTQCTGAFGKYKNMCLLRCENDNTAEGPFGGCVAFNLGGPYTPPPPPPQTSTVTKNVQNGDQTRTVYVVYVDGKPISTSTAPAAEASTVTKYITQNGRRVKTVYIQYVDGRPTKTITLDSPAAETSTVTKYVTKNGRRVKTVYIKYIGGRPATTKTVTLDSPSVVTKYITKGGKKSTVYIQVSRGTTKTITKGAMPTDDAQDGDDDGDNNGDDDDDNDGNAGGKNGDDGDQGGNDDIDYF